MRGKILAPNTAAVTTFLTGSVVRAKTNFVDKSVWDALTDLYQKEPTDKNARRVAIWKRFGSTADKGDETEVFDLDALEDKYIRAGGHSLIIALAPPIDPKDMRRSENDFRNAIQQFTSAAKPHHCLVKSIEIETPSPILNEGVTLIDTPGLDDTERFRVQLTEEAVQDVDAILFLTKSGPAYGQSEKEFLLSLLRPDRRAALEAGSGSGRGTRTYLCAHSG